MVAEAEWADPACPDFTWESQTGSADTAHMSQVVAAFSGGGLAGELTGRRLCGSVA